MESAIPLHLRCPRTRPKRCADDYQPPVPAWTARGDQAIDQIVVGYYGVQWRPGQESDATAAREAIESQLAAAPGIGATHRARYTDPQGYENLAIIAHWTNPEDYHVFARTPAVEGWWASEEREKAGIGLFREIFLPSMTHLETLFNATDHLTGIGEILGTHSQSDVQEHAYWGGMRDRMPASQTDALDPSGTLSADPDARPARIRIIGHDNMAVIRSGQDWSNTSGAERELYLSKMRPVLQAGMDFLSTQGLEIGCYSNRLMQNFDDAGNLVERAFGLGYWRSLTDLEAWAEHHPTHIAIFDGFMNIAKTLEGQFDLRLFHEVLVVKSAEQILEYIGCHPRTGLLSTLSA
ncbi:MAG TPA: phenylacetaldoxime dehydratase family protein [Sphingobium sp.]|nr:phenylacetaldoxime dehydratase family protein [Sphingobium sp.]